MMRIGVDARLMQHQPAGITRYTRHLLQELAKLNDHDEFIVFQHRRHRTPLIEKTNFRRATLYAPVHTHLEQWMLPVELARFSLDLLHSTDFIPPLYTTVPTVITVHDLAFLHWPHFLTKDSAAYYGQIDRAVRHAEHIIVPSESTKQDLTAMLGVPPAKISVIYEAADELFVPLPIEETRAEVMAKYKLPESYILFVGTIEPRKNVDGLIRAFHHLRNKYGINDTALVIAGGKGWLYNETLELIRQLNLEQSVKLVGRVVDAELHKLYVAARCHVHAAHYEGFGLPPLEAMACGTPTIVSNVSSLPEVVGDAALLVDPSNWEEIAVAIHRVLSDDQLHAELREKGLQRARFFNWESAARRTMEVYQLVGASRAAIPAAGAPASSRTTNRL
jgi:glycosyltransferase involved in cell wall biosynthesis